MELLTEEALQAINSLKLPTRFQSKLRQDIAFVLKKCEDIYEIRVFGSCATGKFRASSDIDLLVITKEKIQDRVLRGEIYEALDESKDGISTDVVFYTLDSFLNGQDTFSKELRKDSYLLWKRG
jgi:predicted nucleotidyltransferase